MLRWETALRHGNRPWPNTCGLPSRAQSASIPPQVPVQAGGDADRPVTSRSVRQRAGRHAALRQRMPRVIVCRVHSWPRLAHRRRRAGFRAGPAHGDESLLTITETRAAHDCRPAPHGWERRPAEETRRPRRPSRRPRRRRRTPEDETGGSRPKPGRGRVRQAGECSRRWRRSRRRGGERARRRRRRSGRRTRGLRRRDPRKDRSATAPQVHRPAQLGRVAGASAIPGSWMRSPGPSSSAGVPNFIIRKFRVPPFLLPIYQAAGIEYGVRWEVLAAINEIETDYGRNLNVSSAGAVGWMQFIPSTWRMYGTDANEDGRKDPYNPVDAIFAAARYLAAAGYEDDVRRAVFAYNHADWYVDSVLLRARLIAGRARRPRRLAHRPHRRPLPRLRPRTLRRRPGRGHGRRARGSASSPAEGSPVVAVNDGVIRKVGRERPARASTWCSRTPTATASPTRTSAPCPSFYPGPEERRPAGGAQAVKARARGDPAPTAPASAGSQPDPKAESEDEGSAPATDAAPAASLPVKERLFAHPGAPAAKEAGGLEQTLDARARKNGRFETFNAYFSRPFGLDPSKVRLRRLARGRAGDRRHRARPCGPAGRRRGRPPVVLDPARRQGRAEDRPEADPRRLEAARGHRDLPRLGRNVLYGKGDSLSIGQVLLMPKRLLERRVLSDERVECTRAGARTSVRPGRPAGARHARVPGRVRAEARRSPAQGGHGFLTASGNVSEHISGSAVDIAKVNGIPILGHQEAGGIAEQTVRHLMRLQGTMQPHQVISPAGAGRAHDGHGRPRRPHPRGLPARSHARVQARPVDQPAGPPAEDREPGRAGQALRSSRCRRSAAPRGD